MVSASAGGVTATLRAGTHNPRVGVGWPIQVTAMRGGAPAHASVSYEFLLGSQVVARRSHYSFTGRFSDVLRYPAASVGYPLSFRAVVSAEGAGLNLDYPIQVSG